MSVTEYNRQYRLRNHAKLVARDKERYEFFREIIGLEQRDRYKDFPEKFRMRSRINRLRRSPEKVAADRQANIAYRETNHNALLSRKRLKYWSTLPPGIRDREVEERKLREAVKLFKLEGGEVTRTKQKERPPGPRLAKPKAGT